MSHALRFSFDFKGVIAGLANAVVAVDALVGRCIGPSGSIRGRVNAAAERIAGLVGRIGNGLVGTVQDLLEAS